MSYLILLRNYYLLSAAYFIIWPPIGQYIINQSTISYSLHWLNYIIRLSIDRLSIVSHCICLSNVHDDRLYLFSFICFFNHSFSHSTAMIPVSILLNCYSARHSVSETGHHIFNYTVWPCLWLSYDRMFVFISNYPFIYLTILPVSILLDCYSAI